jgi:hypothetical protein
MRRCVCNMLLFGLLLSVIGCGGPAAPPKLPPEVAKERQQNYENKMTDGPKRGESRSK